MKKCKSIKLIKMHPFAAKEKRSHVNPLCAVCGLVQSSYGYVKRTHCGNCRLYGMINLKNSVNTKSIQEIRAIATILCNLKKHYTLIKMKNM